MVWWCEATTVAAWGKVWGMADGGEGVGRTLRKTTTP